MIGKKIIHKDTVDSTNNYIAKLLLCEDLLNGTVILADEQTNGKGQRGAVWDTQAFQNITMSIYVKHDNLSVNQQFLLSQFVSIGIVDFLNHFQLEAKIKWPNDIVIGNAKIAGILIENQLESSTIKSSIIGIGLNVNQVEFGDYNATSMILQTGLPFKIQELIFILLEKLNYVYQKLAIQDYLYIQDRYLKDLWLLNKKSNYKDSTGIFNGEIVGVDETGSLLIDKNSEILKYQHKEITFLERF